MGVLAVAVVVLAWVVVAMHQHTARLEALLARSCRVSEGTTDDDVYGPGPYELDCGGHPDVEEIDEEVASEEQVDAAIRWCRDNTSDLPLPPRSWEALDSNVAGREQR